MNENIIKNWNSVVKKGDKVYHLGDFGFGSKEQITDIVSQLNGDIYLIRGNHCNHPNQWYRDCGIFEVYDHPIIIRDFIVLSHEPQSFIVSDKGPYINFFGHIHDSPMFETYGKRHFCACVERHDYKPVELNYVLRRIGDNENE